MNRKLLILWIIGLFIAPGYAWPQAHAGALRGSILDTAGQRVPFAVVSLCNLPDSSIRQKTQGTTDGYFILEQVPAGTYFLKIAASGYAPFSSASFRVDTGGNFPDLPPFILQPAGQALQEVTVSSQKPYTEYKADRVVVHVGALIANAGATAYEALERSPGVTIQNGTLSLKGKAGVLVLVDDKPVYQSGADLENLLKSMPADAIDRIELMSNPPAKYDAAGNAGVINLVSRKQKSKGFNGGLNLVLRQGKLSSTYNTLTLNFRKDRFNIFTSFSGGYRQSFEDLGIHRRYLREDGGTEAVFDQNAYSTRKGGIGRARAGLDFYQNEQTIWGMVFTGNLWRSQRQEAISGLRMQGDGTEAYSITGRNTESTPHADGWLNLNYRHNFSQPGRQVAVDADYLHYRQDARSSFDNTVFVPGADGVQDLLEGILNSAISIYTLKADYSQPLPLQWKLDAGVKAAYTITDNLADYFYTAAGVRAPDYDKSNHFLYKENIDAGYINFSREGKLLSVQAGLRLETTFSDGNQLGNIVKPDSAFSRNYTGLFPTLYLQYKTDSTGNHQIGLNAGRRIDRPYFQDLNPFISPIDKFTYYTGNPFLRPAFTSSIELTYTYKSWLSVGLNYSYSHDNVNETVTIVDNIFYSRPGNVSRYEVSCFNLDAARDLTRWLNVHVYMQLGYIHSRTDLYTGPLDTKGSFAMINPDCRIMLSRTWNAELSGRYMSRVTNVQFDAGSLWTVSAGIQKRFSEAMSLKLSLRDIFYTQLNTGTVHNLALAEASWRNRSDAQMAVLSFNYRFGKAIKGQRRHETDGAAGEQGRIKGQ